MEYQKSLQNIGLSGSESRIYISALQLGCSLPAVLAKKADVRRPTLYKILPRLKELGLISETVIGKRKYLVAEDPQVYLEKKQSELEDFENTVPGLRLLLNTVNIKPKIIFYEGIEGIRKLYMDNLKEKKPILEFVSLEKIHPEIEFHSSNYYIPKRINRKIPIKIIVSGVMESKSIKLGNDAWALREVRTIDEKRFPIPLDCYIYGDNVSFALYRTDSEPVGVIIRSKEIATAIRSLFEFMWEKNPLVG